MAYVIVSFILMMFVPIINAIIVLLFASMKNLSEYTVGSYASLGLFFFCGPVIAITDAMSE